MATIVTCKVGNHTYLYESESYRTKDGKVRNNRRIIGKLDPATGESIYKPEYIAEKGLHLEQSKVAETPIYSATDVKQSNVKAYGAFYLLNEITKSTGLEQVLMKVFPSLYLEILNIAFFVISTGEPAMYCEDWLYNSESHPGKVLSSQRISELLNNITNGDRMEFYELWGKHRSETEYVALDLTSITTHSEQINFAEKGYNPGKENLPQVKVCMLMGEESHLPILQVVYSGSLSDVSTLKTTLRTATNLDLSKLSLVMDKGPGKKIANIDLMLSPDGGNKFLVALPFTLGFAKEQVAREKGNIDIPENAFVIGSDIMRGRTSTQHWNEEHDIFVHACFNPEVATKARNEAFSKIYELSCKVKQEPAKHRYSVDVKKYLIVRKLKTSTQEVSVKIRNTVIESELETRGWLILVSNHVDNVIDALTIYRRKDAVEKGFMRLKSFLDLERIRVHSDNAMQNKLFVGFIALIIMAHIHKVMSEKDLYKSWSMKKMIKILERLKIHHIKTDKIISPLTRDHKRIFSAFGVKFDI